MLKSGLIRKRNTANILEIANTAEGSKIVTGEEYQDIFVASLTL